MIEIVLELFKFVLYFNNDSTENFHWTKDKVGQIHSILVALASSTKSAMFVDITRAVSGRHPPWNICSSYTPYIVYVYVVYVVK